MKHIRNKLAQFKQWILSIVRVRFSLLTYRQSKDSWFKLEYKKGDEQWRNSIWLTHWWFGRYYWHCLFL